MNDETTTYEETPKKSTRAKKTEEPKAAPAPKRENPIPGSPEIDGKFPGDEGYQYDAATKGIRDEVKALKEKIEELQELARAITSSKPVKKKASAHDMWLAQKAIDAGIRAEADAKKAQVAAVLKEMKLL